MTHNTNIEWTHIPGFKGETWNPIVGCDVVSPGCTNCYAMRVAGHRLDGNPKTQHYAGTTKVSKAGPVWTGKVALASEKAFTAPLHWAKPRAVFVNSMGDLFHESVPDEWIDRVFAIMALSPQHIFIVLTKRAERMRAYISALDIFALEGTDTWQEAEYRVDCDDDDAASAAWHRQTGALETAIFATRKCLDAGKPLPNVWLGVSVEDQARAESRIPYLLATPAAIRFVSCEPLLGPVDLTKVTHRDPQKFGWLNYDPWLDALTGNYPLLDGCERRPHPNRLHWVIAGGESGPGARPMHPDWARSLRDQCQAAGVPFFFKQWGRYAPRRNGEVTESCSDTAWPDGTIGGGSSVANGGVGQMLNDLGKRAAGHTLDGETHHNWPEVKA